MEDKPTIFEALSTIVDEYVAEKRISGVGPSDKISDDLITRIEARRHEFETARIVGNLSQYADPNHLFLNVFLMDIHRSLDRDDESISWETFYEGLRSHEIKLRRLLVEKINREV